MHYEYSSKGEKISILFLMFNNEFLPIKSFSLNFKTSVVLDTVEYTQINRIFAYILSETLEQKSDHEGMIKAELMQLFILLAIMHKKGNAAHTSTIQAGDPKFSVAMHAE